MFRHIKPYLVRFLQTVVLHPQRGRLLSIVLFLLTCASLFSLNEPELALAVLAIVLAHEMGHVVACRIHGVASTWPLLLPGPILAPLPATFGAVMVIRSPFPTRRALFDIGIAGPLAGLAVCLPVLWFGLHDVSFAPAGDPNVLYLGDPLAFRLLAHHVTFGATPAGMEPRLGPLGAAAWFGFLLTGLNLLPVGQLDGGHILYALFPRRARSISRLLWWLSLGLIVLSPNWILWTVLTRLLIRRPHPPTLDDRQPLGPGRVVVALLAPVAFVISFIPEPVLGGWQSIFSLLRDLAAWITSS